VIEKLGLIGDVHCQVKALRASLARLEAEGADVFLCVGDVLDGAGDPNQTVRILREREVLTVAGNHDRWVIGDTMRDLIDATPRRLLEPETLRWLAELPRTRDIETPAGLALLCHGLGSNDMSCVRPDDEGYALESNLELTRLCLERKYRYVMNGHTHRRMVRTIDGLTIINAGTLLPSYGSTATLVDFRALSVSFFDVGDDDRVELSEQIALGSGRSAGR
jgi:predicted phosphodiesterase